MYAEAGATTDPDLSCSCEADCDDNGYCVILDTLTIAAGGGDNFGMGTHGIGGEHIGCPMMSLGRHATTVLSLNLWGQSAYAGTVNLNLLNQRTDMLATLDRSYVGLSPNGTETANILLETTDQTALGPTVLRSRGTTATGICIPRRLTSTWSPNRPR